MVTDRPETKDNVIDFVKAKQKLQNVKSSTTVLDEEVPIEDDDVFFEIIYDHDNDDNWKKDLIREPYRGGKDTPVYDYTYSLTQFFANCLAIDKESQ